MSDYNSPPPDSPYGNQPPNQPPNQPYGNQPYGNQPYGNQPYGGQPGQPYGGAPATLPKGLAIASLVLGILSLPLIFTIVGGIVIGLVAVILGFVALSKAKKGTGGGRGLAIGGVVTGLLGLVVSIALVVIAALFINSDTGQELQDCLNRAGDDQSAIDQCQNDLEDNIS